MHRKPLTIDAKNTGLPGDAYIQRAEIGIPQRGSNSGDGVAVTATVLESHKTQCANHELRTVI